VKFEILPPGGKPITVLSTTTSKLSTAPLVYHPTKAISVTAKSTLELVGTCATNQPPCTANLLFSGKLS
jgi:hypothetical protein